MKSVYSAVRTGSLIEAVFASYLKGYLRKNSDFFLIRHLQFGFLTEVESVYSAVRTDSLYNIDRFSLQSFINESDNVLVNGRHVSRIMDIGSCGPVACDWDRPLFRIK
jgi:hypothetical protein